MASHVSQRPPLATHGHQVFLEFPEVFWKGDPNSNDPTLSTNADQYTTFNFINEPSTHWVETFNYHATGTKAGTSFGIEIPLLLAFNAGAFAVDVESWTDAQIIEDAMKVFRKTWPNAPNPIKYKITKWGQDPYAKGSYSYARVGSVSPDNRKDIAATVYDATNTVPKVQLSR